MEEVSENYWRVFGSYLANMFELPGVRKVLDVGTGWGDCLIPLARRIGPKGDIIGIDIDEAAVNETRSELNKQSLTNVRAEIMDATDLEFKNEVFDVITCGFIGFDQYYNFEENKFLKNHNNPLMKEIYRVLKRHGTFVLSSWKIQEDLEIAVEMAQKASESPGFSNEHEEGIKFLMEDVGFTDIQIEVIDYNRVYDSLDEWWKTNYLVSYYHIVRNLENDSYLKIFECDGKYYFKKSVIYAKGKKEISC